MVLIRQQICVSWILDFSASRPEEMNACHESHAVEGIFVIAAWIMFLMTFDDIEILLKKPEILIDFPPTFFFFFLDERFSNVSKFQPMSKDL